MKYQKKPVVIDAWPATDSPLGVLCHCDAGRDARPISVSGDLVQVSHVHTLAGPMLVSPGDWIIGGINGQYYPCKPDIFAATYDPVPVGYAEVHEAAISGRRDEPAPDSPSFDPSALRYHQSIGYVRTGRRDGGDPL